MNILLFFSFAPIFVGAITLLINSLLILSADHPWELDAEANKLVLQISQNVTFDDWLNGFGDSREGMLRFVLMFYRYSASVSILVSVLILVVLFFGSRNRMLFITFHSSLCLCLSSFIWLFVGFYEKSYHFRYFLVVYLTTCFGLLCYLLDCARKKKTSTQNEVKKTE
eukprot:TRINITY_DN15168_c0_g1_i1.p1 TRINITY_DN15168_c0_g1~~TRINITY_DN15168_c0_g1_i1.p1  ORF type:complete len:168 (-),score=15.93 TRINITY_DN15168_c0_g1_i1:142-645(-)